ncbi:hypothetical protein JW964_26645 [candidate division KSB1 bacterium]|nr:hypothetical protein [candidate division KSB1 bacterium]
MEQFPRTIVAGISLPRLIIGSNWFLGYSHTSLAKDLFIKSYQTPDKIAEILAVFLEHGIDATMCPLSELYETAIRKAEDVTGKKMIRIITPHFSVQKDCKPEESPEHIFDKCMEWGAKFCFPHQCITDALIDRLNNEIRGFDKYTKLIRERDMIPGLSTHMPEAVVISDSTNADVESYIQIYNAAGFLMQIEADWVMRIIKNAKKPVMTIKPLAAGRLIPPVGLAFVWNTIREQDMVVIGTTTPEEASECIEISLDFLSRRLPTYELQKTRSKKSLDTIPH